MNRMGHSYNTHDTAISKALSWLLRHSAPSEGIHMTEDGFVNVTDILKHKKFVESKCSLDDLNRIVSNDDKQRYLFRCHSSTNELQVRANQGHSIKFVVNPGLQLISNDISTAVHGTYYKYWKSIKKVGLSRMNRVHIHLIVSSPGSLNVISGYRSNCEILLYINVTKAFKDGIKFYKSLNNVILCSGDDNGIILPKYFIKAIDISSGTELLY